MSTTAASANGDNIRNSLIAQTGGTENAAPENVKGGLEGSKGIWDKVKDFAATIGKAIKNFLFGTAGFLKNYGVRIGTSSGVAVGILAVVGCFVSLPFSLPLLGGIVGALFATGAVGKLVDNIRGAEGAANIVKQTLNDIKSDMVRGVKRIVTYITSPKTVYTDISEGILNNTKTADGFKANMSALKDILDFSRADLNRENQKRLGDLKERMETFREKIQGSEKPANPLKDPLEKERRYIVETLKEWYGKEDLVPVHTRTSYIPLKDILKCLIEKFESDAFINTLRATPKAS